MPRVRVSPTPAPETRASVRLLLVRRLEMAGHDVIEARDGREVLRLAWTGDSDPDVVVLDAMMPGATGPSVLNGIKQLRPDLPVVVVSALRDLALDEAWDAADGRLTKPIDFDDLLARVEALTS